MLDVADDLARGRADLQLLEAAGEEAGVAADGPVEVDHLPVRVVRDDHVEGAGGAAHYAGAAVSVLHSLVHILKHMTPVKRLRCAGGPVSPPAPARS